MIQTRLARSESVMRTPTPAHKPQEADKPAMPDFSNGVPMELFTPEALEACPHARAMFERMKAGGPALSQENGLESVALAENGSWIQEKAPANFQAVTQPSREWTGKEEIQKVLSTSPKNVEDNAANGEEATEMRLFARERIGEIQHRQLDAGADKMHRTIHTKQLFGGDVEVHWNPAVKEMFNFFSEDSTGGLARISAASNEQNPDGKDMYGFALELVGTDGQVTDILMTGGTPRTAASQAEDGMAQLALLNMVGIPSKVGGLAKMAYEAGPIDAGRMVLDVGRMKTELNSVSDLEAWSRAPFRLKGKDGHHYLVKMKATPLSEKAPEAEEKVGETTSQRLERDFAARASQGDTRWSFDLQFMQPGDDPNDGRKTWSGPWVNAGEIVIPKIQDGAKAKEMAQAAEETKFNIWKGKEAHDQGPDFEVFYPHGNTNLMRLWAYGESARNRGVAG